MRLIIAEKRSLAVAIAAALPGPQRSCGSHIEVDGGSIIVAWSAGHILEQAPPEEYDARFKEWSLADLPIVPKDWKLLPKEAKLLAHLKGLLARADSVVHAGDPDREGQLLIDEILLYLKYSGPVDRLQVNDQNVDAVRAALAAMRPNAEFRGLYESALGRQRADWLFGLNLTRLYTLLGRRGGHSSVLSVGRVQTPVLGLVVRRDLEIEGFKPKPFFSVVASFESPNGTFNASWRPVAGDEAHLDSEKRLVNRDRAAAVAASVAGRAGTIARASADRKSEAPPLPYSLPALQIDASKQLGFSAKATLDIAQALYETHKILTYPRSDCSYLPEGHLEQRSGVLTAISSTAPGLRSLVNAADSSARSRAWNDKKVTAHHALIPTAAAKPAGLNAEELAIYDLVARRYVAQFYPPHLFDQLAIDVDVNGLQFSAQGRLLVDAGWRTTSVQKESDEPDEPTERRQPLPPLTVGDAVKVASQTVVDKKTSPPKRFDDASLLQAMIGIARFVSDPGIKKILQDTDGIGTPATQAQMIETLLARGFLVRKSKQLMSTATGRQLVAALPAIATTPDMTAVWELALRKIVDGDLTLADFTARVLSQVGKLVGAGKTGGALKAPGAPPCTEEGCSGVMTRRKGKKGDFWGCTEYPKCRGTAQVSAA